MLFNPSASVYHLLGFTVEEWNLFDKRLSKVVKPVVDEWVNSIILSQKWELRTSMSQESLIVLHTFIISDPAVKEDMQFPLFIWLRFYFSNHVMVQIERYLEGIKILNYDNLHLN